MKSIGSVIVFMLCVTSLFVEGAMAQHRTLVEITNASANLPHIARIQEKSELFLFSINQARANGHKPDWSDFSMSTESVTKLDEIWLSSPFDSPALEAKTRVIRRHSGWEIRDIEIRLFAENEDSVYTYPASIQFDESGDIVDVNFSVESRWYSEIIGQGASVRDIEQRQLILDFVERFRTSYNRRDIEFINRVFSEQALIIVGRVLVEDADAGESLLSSSLSTEKVEYVRRTKSEYLAQLRTIFGSNEFIDVGFDEISILRHNDHPDIYGVTLLQYWRSSSYSDTGYIFLMIDFKEQDEPIIHVRTWQPNEHVSREEVFQLGDFEIIDFD